MSRIIDIRLREDQESPLSMPQVGEEIARILNLNKSGAYRFLGGHVTRFEPPKVQVRQSNYRGRQGLLVMSSSGDRIFVETRAAAERIRDRLLNGEDTRAEDYVGEK